MDEGEGGRPFSGRSLLGFSPGGRRLIAAAALLHVALAVGLFWAGRAQVAPGLIDRDGIMGSFAFDGYEYRAGAVRLAEALGQGGFSAWARENAPVHVRLISVEFALLGPLFGYGTLSAEPLNLLCYLAVVTLTLALGREVGGARAGTLAACVVALWPTLLLHTLQLLKDPIFVACALALVLCMTTWLTRHYGPRGAAAAGVPAVVAVSVLLLIRPNFAVVIVALALFGLALLAVRQLIEGRLLYWNMAAPLTILAAGVLVLFSNMPQSVEKFKHYPSDQGGRPKGMAGGEAADGKVQVPTAVSYLPRARFGGGPPADAGWFGGVAYRMTLRADRYREGFAAAYSESGSNVDADVRFRTLRGLLLYLPRAFAIGCCAPFPDTWVAAGRRVGSAGKLLSGVETLVMYVFELLALAAVFRPPRRLAAWLLLSTGASGFTLLALVVPNVGALYRFRYTFWVLLIILGAKGVESLLPSRRPGLGASPAQAAG